MKTLLFCSLLLAVGTAFGQTSPSSRPMVKAGQTFWVCTYEVKADKRTQYEHFVHDIFWPSATKLTGTDRQVFRQTRVMHPGAANPDGTYTYAFIMDPVITGADYEIESLIKKMYGPAKGKEYYKLFETALKPTSNYHQYTLKQAKD